MPKLIKVPKNPLANTKKWKSATSGKLKLYPSGIRRRGIGDFDPDSEAAYSIQHAFSAMIWEEIHDLEGDLDY